MTRQRHHVKGNVTWLVNVESENMVIVTRDFASFGKTTQNLELQSCIHSQIMLNVSAISEGASCNSPPNKGAFYSDVVYKYPAF